METTRSYATLLQLNYVSHCLSPHRAKPVVSPDGLVIAGDFGGYVLYSSHVRALKLICE